MPIIEQPPKIEKSVLLDLLLKNPPTDAATLALGEDINCKYEYWDKVKYRPLPDGWTAERLWTYVKITRRTQTLNAWKGYPLRLFVTNEMQRLCHAFDMDFGGAWESDTLIPDANKQRYFISTMMEEAISSSQMEGASTTRMVAKEMLRRETKPKDKSQRMIYNNYQTIRFIVDNKEKRLTPALLQEVHRLMTEETVPNGEAGHFRQTDDIAVVNVMKSEVVHTPPAAEKLPDLIEDFCRFFNDTENVPFIHPIIRGIILHFMLAYLHPFTDGNGRTARAIFYWYMLRNGYWLMEYLSISRIIYQSKNQYERAFLYTESDEMDVGYFVMYHLNKLTEAFREFKQYLQRKQAEQVNVQTLMRQRDLTLRQAEIVYRFVKDPYLVLTVKDVQTLFDITPTTAKSDLMQIVERGWLEEIALNKVKRGYVRSPHFEELNKPKR